jgi:hypothetical protein
MAKTTKPAAKRKPAAPKAAAAAPAKAKASKKPQQPVTGGGHAAAPAPQSTAPTVATSAKVDATTPAPAGQHSNEPTYVRLPRPEPGDTITSYVRRHLPFVVAAYAMGNTLGSIGESFDPPITGIQLRIAISNDIDMHKAFMAARDHRAHYLVEEATEAALGIGIKKDKAETLLKVAEKTAPHLYGAKSTVALTGAEGGPIASTVEMTPTEAYLRMVKGG